MENKQISKIDAFEQYCEEAAVSNAFLKIPIICQNISLFSAT
jgi:hypothetical protein